MAEGSSDQALRRLPRTVSTVFTEYDLTADPAAIRRAAQEPSSASTARATHPHRGPCSSVSVARTREGPRKALEAVGKFRDLKGDFEVTVADSARNDPSRTSARRCAGSSRSARVALGRGQRRGVFEGRLPRIATISGMADGDDQLPAELPKSLRSTPTSSSTRSRSPRREA
jgi:hypothetical protein